MEIKKIDSTEDIPKQHPELFWDIVDGTGGMTGFSLVCYWSTIEEKERGNWRKAKEVYQLIAK